MQHGTPRPGSILPLGFARCDIRGDPPACRRTEFHELVVQREFPGVEPRDRDAEEDRVGVLRLGHAFRVVPSDDRIVRVAAHQDGARHVAGGEALAKDLLEVAGRGAVIQEVRQRTFLRRHRQGDLEPSGHAASAHLPTTAPAATSITRPCSGQTTRPSLSGSSEPRTNPLCGQTSSPAALRPHLRPA